MFAAVGGRILFERADSCAEPVWREKDDSRIGGTQLLKNATFWRGKPNGGYVSINEIIFMGFLQI